MQHLTASMLAQAINQLGPTFDAHAVEKRTLRLSTIHFANDLAGFAHTSDPLHQFSAAFARFIDRSFTGQIQKTQKVVTENLGGRECENQEWTRLTPIVSVVHTTDQTAERSIR